jgi:hypothetical protein
VLRLTPGLYIENRFRLDHLVGEGGMGCVWAAFDKESATFVALKFPKLPAPLGSERRSRFRAEANVTIVHENIVRMLGTGCLNEQTPFIVMELLHGVTLRDEVRRAGKLSLETACAVLCPVLSALACAHERGIIHRDIKPENIFLSTDEDRKTTVKVLDFGVAKQVTTDLDGVAGPVEGERREARTSLGTLGYASPEQMAGHGVDVRADVWALGVVLYECVTGKRPFPSDSRDRYLASCSGADSSGTGPHGGPERASMRWDLAAGLPPDIQALLAGALAVDPSQRPTLHEMREVLGGYEDPSALPVIERPARPSPEEKAATISTAPGREPLRSQDVARAQPAVGAPWLAAVAGAGEAGSVALRRRRAAPFAWGGAVLGAAAAMLLGAWIPGPEKPTTPSAVQEPLDEARICKRCGCKGEIKFELGNLPLQFPEATSFTITVVIDNDSAMFTAPVSHGMTECSRSQGTSKALDAECARGGDIFITATIPIEHPHDEHRATVIVRDDNEDEKQTSQVTITDNNGSTSSQRADGVPFHPMPEAASFGGCPKYEATLKVDLY